MPRSASVSTASREIFGTYHLFRLALASTRVSTSSGSDGKKSMFVMSSISSIPGQRFMTAVFRLCTCQILLENMRSRALSAAKNRS